MVELALPVNVESRALRAVADYWHSCDEAGRLLRREERIADTLVEHEYRADGLLSRLIQGDLEQLHALKWHAPGRHRHYGEEVRALLGESP